MQSQLFNLETWDPTSYFGEMESKNYNWPYISWYTILGDSGLVLSESILGLLFVLTNKVPEYRTDVIL